VAQTLETEQEKLDEQVPDGGDAVEAVLSQLDREMVGLAPVKERIREMAALLVIDQLRRDAGERRGRENSSDKQGKGKDEKEKLISSYKQALSKKTLSIL